MIDLVVPVYNEAGNIEALLKSVSEKITSPKQVMIVYDSEDDNTLPVVKKIQLDYSFEILLVRNKYGRGALHAIITGMEEAKHECVLVIMADLSDSLEIVDKMYSKIQDEGYDLVCGSRYMRGGRQHGGPFWKGLFSRTAGKSLHILSRIPTNDVTNSFKMYKKTLLDSITFESNGGFEIGMEITVKAYLNGFRVTEIPSQWYDREAGKSNFQMRKWIPKYLHWYWMCIMGASARKRT